MMQGRKLKLLIVLFFMSLIPVVYSSLFLGALMDPYGKVSQLPVAVVAKWANPVLTAMNEHHLFKLENENIDQANADLKQGKVYAIVQFDDNFNDQLNQFVKNQQSPTITLVTSEGLSYTTSKLLKNTMLQFTTEYNNQLAQRILTTMQGQNIPTGVGQIIKLQNEERHPVKNNGTAMAPYIFSLTLFVGGIFINQFVMRTLSRKHLDFGRYWITEFLVPFIIASLQVFILLLVNQLFIKIQIDQMTLLVPFALLVAATFSSIIVALNKLIPGIGSLMVLLLTMLQTSSSGGTYAIELSGSFFKTVNAFLPMTYSIDGFKKLISLNNVNIWPEVFILLAFFILGQLILVRAYRKHELPLL